MATNQITLFVVNRITLFVVVTHGDKLNFPFCCHDSRRQTGFFKFIPMNQDKKQRKGKLHHHDYKTLGSKELQRNTKYLVPTEKISLRLTKTAKIIQSNLLFIRSLDKKIYRLEIILYMLIKIFWRSSGDKGGRG